MTGQFDLLALLDDSPQGKFERFHRDNPDVYGVLVRLAREWRSRFGSRRLGMQMLFERARWEIAMATNDPEFRLNNNHAAFYSRLIMRQEHDLADAFETRRSAADDWAGAA